MQSILRIGERTLSTNAPAAIVLSHRSYYDCQQKTRGLVSVDEKSAARANLSSLNDGGIAQLVERLVRNEKARGSNPLTSTGSKAFAAVAPQI